MEELAKASPNELSEKLDALWDDVLALQNADPVQGQRQARRACQANAAGSHPAGMHTAPSHLKVAFVHERTPGTSSWTSQHEFGRTQLDSVFAGKVETDSLLQRCPRAGTPMPAGRAGHLRRRRRRIHHQPQAGGRLPARRRQAPQVRILNCSMEMPYASIRTYYTRVYEAKFITGAIAGGHGGHGPHRLCGGLPSFGVPANINAFALGARMVNPRARIELLLDLPARPGGPAARLYPEGHHGDFGPRRTDAEPPAAGVRHLPYPPGRRIAGSGYAVLALGPVL